MSLKYFLFNCYDPKTTIAITMPIISPGIPKNIVSNIGTVNIRVSFLPSLLILFPTLSNLSARSCHLFLSSMLIPPISIAYIIL
ncbi:hypothetical protein Z962_p0115 (plasmid) [Clostridium botulinum C/D str. BKT12695]|nr:hypothetical protein Z962_p0115 [Clostridium botulinum C/D str. BKT12695]